MYLPLLSAARDNILFICLIARGTICILSVLVNSASNIVTVVKIESRSFSRAEIQQFNTDNRQSDYKGKEYL
jgi:hypothetical protein